MSYDDIIAATCKVLDCSREQLLTKCRKDPLPTFRGFLWYVLRKTANCSNKHIAQIPLVDGGHFSATAVGIAINRAIERIKTDSYYHECWDKITNAIPFQPIMLDDIEVTLTINVPLELKGKIKINVNEKVKS